MSLLSLIHIYWKPEEEDKEHKNALVARGYYQAFQAVRGTIPCLLYTSPESLRITSILSFFPVNFCFGLNPYCGISPREINGKNLNWH